MTAPTKFTPNDLLEGISKAELLAAIVAASDTLETAFGKDREAICVTLCYMLGRSIKGCNITFDMAMGMVKTAEAI